MVKMEASMKMGVPDEMMRIILMVSEKYGVSQQLIMSRRRDADIAWARSMAMYLIKRKTQFTLNQIGRAFGRDHTNVIKVMQTVNDICSSDKRVKAETEGLLNAF